MNELNFILKEEIERSNVNEEKNIFAGNYKFSTQNTVVYDDYCYVVKKDKLLKIHTKCDKIFCNDHQIAILKDNIITFYKDLELVRTEMALEGTIFNDFPFDLDNKDNLFLANGRELVISPKEIKFGDTLIKNPIHIEGCRYLVAYYDKITVVGNDKSLDFVYFYNQQNVEPNDCNRLSLRIDDNFDEINITDIKFFGSYLYLIDKTSLRKYSIRDLPDLEPPSVIEDYVISDDFIVLKDQNTRENDSNSRIVNDLPDIENEVTSIFKEDKEIKGVSTLDKSLERLQDHFSKVDESELFSKDLSTLLKEGSSFEDPDESDKIDPVQTNSTNEAKEDNDIEQSKLNSIDPSKSANNSSLNAFEKKESQISLPSTKESSFLDRTKSMFSPTIQNAIANGNSWLKKKPLSENDNESKETQDKISTSLFSQESAPKQIDSIFLTDNSAKAEIKTDDTKQSLFATKFNRPSDSLHLGIQPESKNEADLSKSVESIVKTEQNKTTSHQSNPTTVFGYKRSGIFTLNTTKDPIKVEEKNNDIIKNETDNKDNFTNPETLIPNTTDVSTSKAAPEKADSIIGKIDGLGLSMSDRIGILSKSMNKPAENDVKNESTASTKAPESFVSASRPLLDTKVLIDDKKVHKVEDTPSGIDILKNKAINSTINTTNVKVPEPEKTIDSDRSVTNPSPPSAADKAKEKAQIAEIETTFNQKLQELNKMFKSINKQRVDIPGYEIVPSRYDLDNLYNTIFNNSFSNYEETLSSMIVYLDQIKSIDHARIEESIKYFEQKIIEKGNIKKPVKYSTPIPMKFNDVVKTSNPVDDLIRGIKILNLESMNTSIKYMAKSEKIDQNITTDSNEEADVKPKVVAESSTVTPSCQTNSPAPRTEQPSFIQNNPSGFLNLNRPAVNIQTPVINNSYQASIDYDSHPLLVKDSTSLFNSIANNASIDPRLIGGAPTAPPAQPPEPQNPGQPMSIFARLAASKRMFQGN